MQVLGLASRGRDHPRGRRCRARRGRGVRRLAARRAARRWTATVPAPGSAVSDHAPDDHLRRPRRRPPRATCKVTVDGRDATADVARLGRPARRGRPREARRTAPTRWTSASTAATSSRARSRTSWDFDVNTSRPDARACRRPTTGAPDGPPRGRSSPAPPSPAPTVTVAVRGRLGRRDGRVRRRVGDGRPPARGPRRDDGHGADARRQHRPRARRAGHGGHHRAPACALTRPRRRRADHRDRPAARLRHRRARTARATCASPPRSTARQVATAKGSDAATSGRRSRRATARPSGTTTSALEVDGRRFALAVGTLPQGTQPHHGRRPATGPATSPARSPVVNVNSTDEFGAVDIAAGARGADVVALQKRLREAKVYPKKAKLSGVYDPVTTKSRRPLPEALSTCPVTGVGGRAHAHARWSGGSSSTSASASCA